jgi:uncharacterized membrane protein
MESMNPTMSDGAPSPTTKISRGLGVFSVGLGAAELAIPGMLNKLIGVAEPGTGSRNLMRAMGAREIANGLAVLFQPQRPTPLWARVAGDVVDLACLLIAARSSSNSRMRLAGAAAAVLGVGALDILAARRTQRAYNAANRPVMYSVTINRPVMDVYSAFRQLENLPSFMHFLDRVEQTDMTRSHWVAKLPIGGKVEWDAEIIEDIPGQVIEWRTVEGSKIKLRGRVIFTPAPSPHMTEVRVEMQLGFTGVHPSTGLAKLFAKPQLKGDLRRFKQVMETGEVLYSDASIHRAPHPAQPSNQPAPEQQRFGELPGKEPVAIEIDIVEAELIGSDMGSDKEVVR